MLEKPSFTLEEDEEIKEIALQAALQGEAGYDSVLLSRHLLVNFGLDLMQENPNPVGEIRKAFNYDIALVNAVLEKTRLLMQFFGLDDISKLRQICQERGLGCLFDPESEASKRFGSLLHQ